MKIKKFMSSFGTAIAWIGLIVSCGYLYIKNGDTDVELAPRPPRPTNYSPGKTTYATLFGDKPKPDSSESDGDYLSAIKAIQFFRKDANNRLYECDKVDLARKIYDIVEHVPCELVKSAAISALEDISNSLLYESDKDDVSELIADIVEL